MFLTTVKPHYLGVSTTRLSCQPLAPLPFELLIVFLELDYHYVGLSNVGSVSNACSMMSIANSSEYRS